MRIDVLTLFPELVDRILSESVVGRGRAAGLFSVVCHQIRDFAQNKHNNVADTPYGGGNGMVMAPGPIKRCFDDAVKDAPDGERRRVWSSCMLDDYCTVAGGHNVRAKAGDRMRFKAMHKLFDYNARFGKGNMCVGCGRCDMRCPKDIHFSETIERMAAAVETLKEGKES